jgi:hypothetical protein
LADESPLDGVVEYMMLELIDYVEDEDKPKRKG